MLLADNLSAKLQALASTCRSRCTPTAVFRDARFLTHVVRHYLGACQHPGTSLNQPVRVRTATRFLRADLTAMKEAAHAHGREADHVVLDLWLATESHGLAWCRARARRRAVHRDWLRAASDD